MAKPRWFFKSNAKTPMWVGNSFPRSGRWFSAGKQDFYKRRPWFNTGTVDFYKRRPWFNTGSRWFNAGTVDFYKRRPWFNAGRKEFYQPMRGFLAGSKPITSAKGKANSPKWMNDGVPITKARSTSKRPPWMRSKSFGKGQGGIIRDIFNMLLLVILAMVIYYGNG